MSRRHQTKNGPNAGKWVSCPAKQTCRNKGVHIGDMALHTARYYHEQTTGQKFSRLPELPLQAVETFLALPPKEQKEIEKNFLKGLEHKRQKAQSKNTRAEDIVRIRATHERLNRQATAINGYFPQEQNAKIAEGLYAIIQMSKKYAKEGKTYKEFSEEASPLLAKLVVENNFTEKQRNGIVSAINDATAVLYASDNGNFKGTTKPGLIQMHRANLALVVLTDIIKNARIYNPTITQQRYENLAKFYDRPEHSRGTSPRKTPAVSSVATKTKDEKINKKKAFQKIQDFFNGFKINEF